MKKIVLIILINLGLFSISKSQIEFGMKAGINSVDLASEGINIINADNQTFNLLLEEANYGIHFGLYTRVSLLGFFIEPSALFNSNSVNFRIEDVSGGEIFSDIKKETYHNLDIPVMVGVKVLFLRIYGGPVAHLHLNSSSEILDIDGYSQRFKEASYGYQVGVGLDILKMRFQLNYEGNLSKFGDHIMFNGQNYTFDDRPARLIATIGVKF